MTLTKLTPVGYYMASHMALVMTSVTLVNASSVGNVPKKKVLNQ